MTTAVTPEQLPDLPPASDRQGNPGHDAALERVNAIRLLTLRAQGLTYEQMAQELGYADGSGARHALLRALDRHEAENVSQLRALENLRLDTDERVLRTILANPEASDKDKIAAVNARVRLSARRARFNGLDAPMQVEISSGAEARLQDALADARAILMGVVAKQSPDGTHTITDLPEE